MAYTVHKYALSPGRNNVTIPSDYTVLDAQFQHSGYGNDLALWAYVDAESERRVLTFEVCPTGGAAPRRVGRYPLFVATAQDPKNGTVWHVFNVPAPGQYVGV